MIQAKIIPGLFSQYTQAIETPGYFQVDADVRRVVPVSPDSDMVGQVRPNRDQKPLMGSLLGRLVYGC